MTHDETTNPQIDPLTIGELITLHETAEYAELSKESIHTYVRKGQLKARKRGWMWFTTCTAVEACDIITSADHLDCSSPLAAGNLSRAAALECRPLHSPEHTRCASGGIQ